MADSIIKISQLNPLGTLSRYDFFPIDQSSSLTTFRTDINTLNTWFAASGSASYSSTSSYTVSASYVKNSVSASYVPATYQVSASISSSYSATSSAATSSSYALRSTTASYALSSPAGSTISASYALRSTTASYALNSPVGTTISASYALRSTTASYALNSPVGTAGGGPTFITPIVVLNDSPHHGSWVRFSGSVGILPTGTSAVILDGWTRLTTTTNNTNIVYISQDGLGDLDSHPRLLYAGKGATGNLQMIFGSGQGTFPCATDGSFYYYVTSGLALFVLTTIRLVGYY
jgi:hypothetical protein